MKPIGSILNSLGNSSNFVGSVVDLFPVDPVTYHLFNPCSVDPTGSPSFLLISRNVKLQ